MAEMRVYDEPDHGRILNDPDDGDIDSSGSEYEDDDDELDSENDDIEDEKSIKTMTDLPHLVQKAKTKIKQVFNSDANKDSEARLNRINHEQLPLRTEELYGEDSAADYAQYPGKKLMIVIQNKKYKKSQYRVGSTQDVKKLKSTFNKLGFTVKVYRNLSAIRIDLKLRKASQKFNHNNASCFACVILSHGNEYYTPSYQRKDSILGTDEENISVERIMHIFNDINCPALIGKPRLFFIQACRGYKYDVGVNVAVNPGVLTLPIEIIGENELTYIDAVPCRPSEQPSESTHVKPTDVQPNDAQPTAISEETKNSVFIEAIFKTDEITTPKPCYADSVVMFASPPGYSAYSRKGGSIFISCLCDEFKNYSRTMTFFRILTKVSKQMAFHYESGITERAEYSHQKIVPCLHSSLTRDIKFTLVSE